MKNPENKTKNDNRKTPGSPTGRPRLEHRGFPERAPPVLRFTPTAWASLLFFCHRGQTEIGGFGVASADDPLRVEAFATVAQTTTSVSVAFDDAAVADFFDTQVDAGRRPHQFARIWSHTHPGDSPQPSGIDEETFQRVFGRSDWAVMFILARGGETYARLRFNAGPGGDVIIPVRVDYSGPFLGTDHEAWAREYELNVRAESIAAPSTERRRFGADEWDAFIEQPAGAELFSSDVLGETECGVEVPW